MSIETQAIQAENLREHHIPDQTGTPSVELRDIHKRFASVVAVDGISLRVQPGEFLTLLGPSGCGKTTTLRLVAGFERPSSGEVLIDGQPVTGLPPNRRNVNTVFQNYALFPHMDVAANIDFGMRMKRVASAERARRVGEALQMVQLEGLGARRPTQLSGGQQQRVALARALVNRPAVLLLDEPLGALDLKLRRAMQVELRHLNRSVGITFIYVTHDQEEALTMSDRIAVMSGGRILQLGTAREIYETPATRFVADFIGESNFLDGTLTSLQDGMATVEIPGAGTIRARCNLPLVTGAKAGVAIRPERIAIESPGDADVSDANRVTAHLSEAIYAGSTMLYTVVLAGGATLVVRAANPGAAAVPGAELRLQWLPEACSVLAD